MKIPEEAVHEFIVIYKKKFGVELGFENAKQRAINFLSLTDLISTKSGAEMLLSNKVKGSIKGHST